MEKHPRNLDTCPYFHRTSVIMVDGEVVSCANFYAENVGDLKDKPLSEIWNDGRLTDLRHTFGTDKEWSQCSSCWFREIGYQEQRTKWHARHQSSLDKPTRYTEKSWNFIRFKGNSNTSHDDDA